MSPFTILQTGKVSIGRRENARLAERARIIFKDILPLPLAIFYDQPLTQRPNFKQHFERVPSQGRRII